MTDSTYHILILFQERLPVSSLPPRPLARPLRYVDVVLVIAVTVGVRRLADIAGQNPPPGNVLMRFPF